MELWEFLLALIIFLPIMVLWLGCVIDIIGRPDYGGVKKVLWLLFVLLVPLLGSLIYILARPKVIMATPNAFDNAWEGSPKGIFDIVDDSQPPRRPGGY